MLGRQHHFGDVFLPHGKAHAFFSRQFLRFFQPHRRHIHPFGLETVFGQKNAVAPLARGQIQRPPAFGQQGQNAGDKLIRLGAEHIIIGKVALIPFAHVFPLR